MPNTPTTAPAPQVEEPAANAAETAGAATPFVRASDENLQPANIDSSLQITAAMRDFGTFDVASYGYMQLLIVKVSCSGGTTTTAVGTEDAPWVALQNVQLTEPNGAYIVQFTNGYEMFLANKFCGYNPPYSADPRRSPFYSGIAASTGHFSFIMYMMVEVSRRDGVGALANQDSAGQFKFRCSLAPSATIYASGTLTTLPTVRLQVWLSAYDQPEATSAGAPNQTEPPAHGTTSFWTVQSGITVNAGNNTIELKRKGNYLRVIIFILRRGGTSRANGESDWPTETRFLRDKFPARYYDFDVWRYLMFSRSGFGGVIGAEALTNELPGGLDNGVRVHDYIHEFTGGYGQENRDGWQPTRGSTALEIVGTFANSGTLTVITNDVAIAQNVFL
jgi:hypothetical protein